MSNLKFIRFGGLSSVKQKGYNPEMPTYHCPPKRKGIYAFPENYIEFFLLGGEMSNIYSKHSKFDWIKDKDGNRIEMKTMPDDVEYISSKNKYCHKDGKEYIFANWRTQKDKKDEKHYYVKFKKFKKFEYTGDIWHHLDDKTEMHDIIERKGNWIQTTSIAYKKALSKEVGQIRYGYYRYDKDFMEVFIEKV